MPAAAQGMDEVNPDQADMELAHKAGVKQNKENAKAFLFLAQESLKGMDKQGEVNPFLFARMPAAAQGMDEVNPDQVDRGLAHKAGVKQNKENGLTCKSRGNKTFSLLNPRWPVSNSFYH